VFQNKRIYSVLFTCKLIRKHKFSHSLLNQTVCFSLRF